MMPYAKGVSAKSYDFGPDGKETGLDLRAGSSRSSPTPATTVSSGSSTRGAASRSPRASGPPRNSSNRSGGPNTRPPESARPRRPGLTAHAACPYLTPRTGRTPVSGRGKEPVGVDRTAHPGPELQRPGSPRRVPPGTGRKPRGGRPVPTALAVVDNGSNDDSLAYLAATGPRSKSSASRTRAWPRSTPSSRGATSRSSCS